MLSTSNKILLLLLFTLISCTSIQDKGVTNFGATPMNTEWGFYLGDVYGGEAVALDDELWQPIALPHIMRLEPKHCGGNIIYQGIGWYRRYFVVDESRQNQKVYLNFEGVMTNCTVYINGQKVTDHFGGYMDFEVDATPYIKWGETNVVAVRVSAEHDPLTPPGKPQEGMDFNYYSGIYRDVYLEYRNRLHVTNPISANTEAGGGIFVTYPEVNKEHAFVNIKTQIANEFPEDVAATLSQVLTGDDGVVAQCEQTIELSANSILDLEQQLDVDNPTLWHPNNPHLYRLETSIYIDGNVVDRILTNVGIRTIKQTTEGFFINGEKLYLRGTNRHQCFPNVGDAVSNSMHKRDALLIKQGGYNAVRAAHYTHDPAFLDACDEYGLLVVECIPGWQHWNNDPIFAQRLYQAGREMIRRDRNHPSIFLWETMLNETRYPKYVADSIQHIAHTEYPGDQMYTAGDYWGHQEVADCFDAYYKQVDKFPADGDVMTNIPEDMISIAALYSREWGDGAGDKPRVSLAEDEYEQWRQCRSRLECLDGRGYFDWCMLDANPHMAGHFSWCFMDIARGLSRTTEYCGAVDMNRYPKMSYYMHQSMRDPRVSPLGWDDGAMVYIASYNSGEQFASSAKEIWVFSNCDSVTLYRNDAKVGTITRQQATPAYANVVSKGGSPAFIFNVDGYEAGTLKADAYLDGDIAATHSVTTAGKPHHLNIRLADDDLAIMADGSDMAPVWIEVMDENNNRVTDSEALIHIAVEGCGHLIGEGNAYAAIENQYVEGGVGFCFIRTSRNAGTIDITASSEGLESATKTIKTISSVFPEIPTGNGTRFAGKEVVPEVDESDLVPLSQKLNAVKIWKVYSSATSASDKYPLENIIDGDDESWWISSSGKTPQSVIVEFQWPTYINFARIKFQKDSSVYKHRVEISRDGKTWTEVFVRESTGWDIKPFKLACEVQCMRITFLEVSEGNPGLAEVSLYE